MKYIILNPKACGGTAQKKWEQVSLKFLDYQLKGLDELDSLIDELQEDDTVISAGGDGLLNSLVNRIIEKQGLVSLKKYRIGYLALGSNNSYLQPLAESPKLVGYGVRYSSKTVMRDLIEVQWEAPRTVKWNDKNQSPIEIKSTYLVSNGSIGLLADANDCFNQNSFVQILKRLSPVAADVSAFALTLSRFKAKNLTIETGDGERQLVPTNLHFLKSPYFTKDLAFPVGSSIDSGEFDFFYLGNNTKFGILGRFLQMMLLKRFEQGFEERKTLQDLKVRSETEILLEVDGEILKSKNFTFICRRQSMRACL